MRIQRLLLLLALTVTLTACGPAMTGGGAPAPEPTEPPAVVDQGDGPTEIVPTATPANVIPEDIPVVEGALELKVTAGGNTIAYQAPETTLETVTAYYQTELETLGWVMVNKKDSGFADSITLLRKKPDRNLSITLQSIAGSQNVRVLITIVQK